MLLVASETGHVYTFATRKLQPMIISDAGKALIQTCLNSPDSDNLLMSASGPSNANAASQQASPASNSSSGSSSSGASPQNPASQQQQAPASPTAASQQQHSSQASNGLQLYIGSQQHQNQQQQQHQQVAGNSTSANDQLCAPIQSQHNMMQLNSATSSNSPSSSSANINGSQSSTSNGTNNANSTTDQRMSATGFEETDLSYSINDDLNERVSTTIFQCSDERRAEFSWNCSLQRRVCSLQVRLV